MVIICSPEEGSMGDKVDAVSGDIENETGESKSKDQLPLNLYSSFIDETVNLNQVDEMLLISHLCILLLVVAWLMLVKAERESPLLSIDKDQQQLLLDLNNFTLNIFAQLKKTNKNTNILFSPLGLFQSVHLMASAKNNEEKASTLLKLGLAASQIPRFEMFLSIEKQIMLSMKSPYFSVRMIKHLYVNNPHSQSMEKSPSLHGTIWNGQFNDLSAFVQSNLKKESNGLIRRASGDIDDSADTVLINWNHFISKWQYKFTMDTQSGMMILDGMLGFNLDPHLRCQISGGQHQPRSEHPQRFGVFDLVEPDSNVAFLSDTIVINPEGIRDPLPPRKTTYGKPDAIEVTLDIPFQFYIVDNIIGGILFYGRMNNPASFQSAHDEL
ncbi:hypothetical protein CAPTEDRAFT_210136 [Capitella teleta]|uniref:Serpin domain-containing protein n=1 Tax=Capitella teleta TaxID=283909 RepID=R7TVK3_CAPTE|nr:hypothetical protein CAPTEDRAFT_210136 [Capitella teleta]|eukprot:ELT97744.1 hypothetical protein CAPTEDRAFT_210136 [Capitella teleta]